MQKIRTVESLAGLPSPLSISVWWNGGSILALLLGVQIVTGLFLSMHYTADMVNTFNSVVHLTREVSAGWLVRGVHANSASFFFMFMYLHIGRGLYYQSYISQPHTWSVGVTILLVSMATAFLGYVLPWGQMSYWGATVITNLVSAIPYWGPAIVEWVWGGFSVGQATLNRFYSLHFILPFLIGALSALHMLFLHEKGSTNPLGEHNHVSKVPFHPYFTWKDMVGFLVVAGLLMVVVLFYPSLLGDPENYTTANSMVTPTHIQPEWYFLFAYAILRSIPSKLGGVVALAMSVLILYFLPLASGKSATPAAFTPPYQVVYWVFVLVFILLTWLGACPIEEPYPQLSSALHSFMFVLLGSLAAIPAGWKTFIY
uniref:Cytochrome b n=1 Tax=Leucophytia bidentata TaxID=999262 RepID=G8HMU4_9EUPU|nr:cytochrome b [Leucophytia bidentata]AEQ93818.1 cytochrome b [Leucophytia bidentata]